MKSCKECVYSKIVIPKNPYCIPEAVCTLSDKEFHDCLYNDYSKFSEIKKNVQSCIYDKSETDLGGEEE